MPDDDDDALLLRIQSLYFYQAKPVSVCGLAPCHSGFRNARRPASEERNPRRAADLQTPAELLDKPETEEHPLKSAPSASWLG